MVAFVDAFRRSDDLVFFIRPGCPGDPVKTVDTLAGPTAVHAGVFSSRSVFWPLLDGWVVHVDGYGFGSRSGEWVRGTQLLRWLCHELGVTQPRRLKEERGARLSSIVELEAIVARQLGRDRAELVTVATQLAAEHGTVNRT